MSGKGKFSGFEWHTEFHTVNSKKEKAADCVFLTTDRICQNKKSYHYLAKCFVASNCPLRVKEKDSAEPIKNTKSESTSIPKKQSSIKKIKCTLPEGCKMYSERFGQGKYINFDEKSKIIYVQFADERIVRFLYPNAILDKHLTVSEGAFKAVLNDISRAERG